MTLAATFDGAEPSTDGQFTVTASSAAGVGGLTVLFSDLGGTAGSGTDYAPLSGSVVIPEGNTAATIPVSVIDDAVPEATETVIVALSPDAAYTVGSPSMATLNITDDDAVAAIDSADYKVNNAAFFFDVAVSGVPSSITVNLQISTSQNFASPFERFNIRFDSDTGAIDSAVVETISSPPNDRWLD